MKVLALTSYHSDVSNMFWPKLGHLLALKESKVDLHTVQKCSSEKQNITTTRKEIIFCSKSSQLKILLIKDGNYMQKEFW